MAVARKIISYILAVILSVCIISATLLLLISNSILNKTNVKKELLDTDYYYYVYSIIEDSCNSTILQSGFDSKIMKNVMTEKQVQADVDKLIDCLYDNNKVDISTTNMRQTLESNIQSYIEQNNYEVSDETKESIKDFENTIIDTYKNNIMYSEDSIREISKYLAQITGLVRTAITVILTVSVILLLIVFLLNKSAIGIGLIIAGSFFMVVKTYSGVNMAINNVLILNWAFSKSVTCILNNLLQNLFISGIIMFILGIIIIILGEILKIRNLEKKENK